VLEGWSIRTPAKRGKDISDSSQALQPGHVLGGRYEILGMLGQGGMGTVYKAQDREVNREVALKVIRPELTGHPDIIQRFKQELILARQVTHKNVVRIFDLGEAEGAKFISMEYIDGRDLKSLLAERGKFEPHEAVGIIEQVSHALDAAHSEGVTHRDLKPQNIMVDKHGRVAVMDFGIACSTEMSGLTQTGALVGTPEYMSPEQAKGEHIDSRSDLFSLGIIFYELLTGKSPYAATTSVATLLKRTQERAVPPVKLEPAIPKLVNDIVLRCLEIERERRFQTAREIAEGLETRRVAARGLPAGIRMARLARAFLRPRWAVVVGAVILLTVAAVALRHKLTPAPRVQPKPLIVLVADFSNTTGEPLFDGALEPTFGIALEGASFITAYSRGQAHKLAAQLRPGTATLNEESARLVAQREGISVIIAGGIASEGSHYRVSSMAMDALAGKAIATSEVRADNKDQVLRSVDRLAARMRAALGDATPEFVQIAQAETFTSGSIEAAHQYAMAKKLEWAGKYEEAVQAFKQTIQLDVNMGRAYAGIGAILNNLGQRREGEQYYKEALAKIDSMSEREKYRTRGAYYLIAREPYKALEEFSKLVELYPADSAGAANLALAYFYLRNMPRALKEGRRAIEISPRNVPQRNNLGLYAMYAGDFGTAVKEQRIVLELNPSFERAYVGLALSQLAQGRTPEAVETYTHLQGVSAPGKSFAAAGLTDVALYEGRTSDAIRILEDSVKSDLESKYPEGAARDLATLGEAQWLLGHREQALASAERALKASQDDNVKYIAARVYLEAGQPQEALAAAKDLSGSLETDSQAYARLLEGEVALEGGQPREALRVFQDAKNLADTWMGRLDSARAYLALGAFPEADSELENCIARRGEATALFLDEVPTYHLFPPVYYYLGRALEGLKSPGASESYKTFLAIKEKGGEDPLVSDARRRIRLTK
jgi:tetratricopeptide (TPR) repeat protein/predicted Ser/Thr protein kinase